MTIEERIVEANARVNKYWDSMNIAKEVGNASDEEYWMNKWAAACEVYETITDTEWFQVKKFNCNMVLTG